VSKPGSSLPFALSLPKGGLRGNSWFDRLTTNGLAG